MDTLSADGAPRRIRTRLPDRATVAVLLAVALATAFPERLPAQPWSVTTPAADTASSDARSPGWGDAVRSRSPAWFRAGLRRSVRLEGRDRLGRSSTERGPSVRRRARPRSGPGPGRFAGPATPAEESGATAAELAAGGLLGGTLGFAAGGLGLTRLLCAGEGRADQHSGCITFGTIVLGLVGESVGLSTGVHVANGRRGSWLASTAASLGVGYASLYLSEDSPQAPAAVVLPLGVVAQTVAAGLIEKRTAD